MSEHTAANDALIDSIENALVEYDEQGQLFGSSGAGAYFLAKHLAEHDVMKDVRGEGLALAADLLRKVVDYWDGRPTTHHGDHIYADLRDVLKAITPVEVPQ